MNASSRVLRDALLVDAGKAAGLQPNDEVATDVEMQSASDGRRALDDGTAWEGRSTGEGRVARAFGERTRRVLVMMALAATLAAWLSWPIAGDNPTSASGWSSIASRFSESGNWIILPTWM